MQDEQCKAVWTNHCKSKYKYNVVESCPHGIVYLWHTLAQTGY